MMAFGSIWNIATSTTAKCSICWRSVNDYDIDCLVRPPTTQRTRLYRFLEDGAAGLMIPFVSDADTAREIVMAAKYPPIGNRGLDGAGLDADFGLDSWRSGSTISPMRIARPSSSPRSKRRKRSPMPTRSPRSRALTRFSLVQPISGCAWTTYPEYGMTVDDAVARVAAAAKLRGKVWARTASSIEEVDRYRRQGALMAPHGSDFALRDVLRQASEEMDRMLGGALVEALPLSPCGARS